VAVSIPTKYLCRKINNNVFEALEVINETKTSPALFAPGWVYEVCNDETQQGRKRLLECIVK
jgi:hypothetical protein